jgi:proteasome lid subunit RPN8/RPN11
LSLLAQSLIARSAREDRALKPAAFLSHSQTKCVSARSFVQDSGARSWAHVVHRFCDLTVRMRRLRTGVASSVTAVLKIAREQVDVMIAHALEDHPDEACGVIVGSEGTDVPTRLVRMINADRSPTFFRFDPQEQFELYKTMSAAGEEIVVVYHSHTSTEAYPSRTDITLASEPQAHYVLVSTADSGAADGPVSVRSYRIVDGVVTEEEIEVTE